MSPKQPIRVTIGDRAWGFEAGPAGASEPPGRDPSEEVAPPIERLDQAELEPAGPSAGFLRSLGTRRGVQWEAQPTAKNAFAEDGARFEIVVDGWRFEARIEPLARAHLRDRARRGAASAAADAPLMVRAPIPGRIGSLRVHEGEVVEAGAALLTLEAMKMENVVRAPRAGTIVRIAAAAGRTVELGDTLLELA